MDGKTKNMGNLYPRDIAFQEIIENMPVGILVFDSELQIISVNRNFYSFGLLKSDFKDIVGKNLLEEHLLSDLTISEELKEIVKGQSFEKEIFRKKRLDGGEIAVVIKGTPLSKNDKFQGGILIVEDFHIEFKVIEQDVFRTQYFSKIFSTVYDSMLIVDNSGNIEHIQKFTDNENIPAILGRNPVNVFEFFRPDQKKLVDEVIKKCLKDEKPEPVKIIFEKRNNIIHINFTFIPYTDKKGETLFILVFLKDVGEEITSAQNLKNELAELRKYLYISSEVVDALINLDMDGNIIFWNESAARLFGYTRSEVFGKYFGKVLPVFTKDYFQKVKQELKPPRTWDSEFKFIKKDNSEEYVSIRIGLIGEETEQSIIILCSSITERIKIEKELRQSEEHFRNLVTSTHEYICTLSLTGDITYANPAFTASFGFSEEEFSRLKFIELIDKYYREKNNLTFAALTGYKESLELPLITKDSRLIFVLANFSSVYDASGRPKNYDVILTDITKNKEAEKDLLLIRSVFDVSRDGISVQTGRKYILVNNSLAGMFGYKNAEEVIGKDPLDLVADKDIPRIAAYIEAREKDKDSPNVYEFTGIRKDGSEFYVEKSVTTYISNEIKYVVSIFRDITEQKKAQLALAESEERYRSITENIDEFMWTAEKSGANIKTIFFTSAVSKITSYSGEEFLKNPKLWYKVIHPDDKAEVIRKTKKLYEDPGKSFNELEYRIINKDGNIIWIKNKINVLRDYKGNIIRIYGLVGDITSEKKAEEKLKQSAEDLKVLNETKDRFISIVSHDLRTPFNSILGFTDILLTEDLTPEKQRQYISFIQESSKNMLQLTTSLLDWTRLQTGRIEFEPQRINAKAVIIKVIQTLSGASLKKGIELRSDVENNFYIHADENLVFQVFNNLISNAIKFTKKDGLIVVNAEPLVDKRQVKFSIKDDGVGIKEEDRSKLFKLDTKFTLKGTAGETGSGLGLSLCQEIVKKHGGEIWVESEYGKGSEFIFTFPISSSYILLVDDSSTDRILYSKLLKGIMPKYSIIEAADGNEALEKIKQFQPALVITDHDMPGMNGVDVINRMVGEKLRFVPPVIVLSREIDEQTAAEYKNLNVEYVFTKPVDLSTFKFAIENSLKKAIIS